MPDVGVHLSHFLPSCTCSDGEEQPGLVKHHGPLPPAPTSQHQPVAAGQRPSGSHTQPLRVTGANGHPELPSPVLRIGFRRRIEDSMNGSMVVKSEIRTTRVWATPPAPSTVNHSCNSRGSQESHLRPPQFSTGHHGPWSSFVGLQQKAFSGELHAGWPLNSQSLMHSHPLMVVGGSTLGLR